MTEIKFYVPDERIPSVNAFRIIHGKSWGRRILEFIEKEIAVCESSARNAVLEYSVRNAAAGTSVRDASCGYSAHNAACASQDYDTASRGVGACGTAAGTSVRDAAAFETAARRAACRTAADASGADYLYKKYFGDIAAERSFIASMDEDICFAEQALTNRLCTVRRFYPEKYPEIYSIFRGVFPRIAKRMEAGV